MTTICKFPSCTNPIGTRKSGLCCSHIYQQKHGYELRPLRKKVHNPVGEPCPIPGCANIVATGGFCGSHARVAWRMGIDPHELVAMYIEGCQLCGSHKNIYIDHDHSCCPTLPACGKCVRGPLCAGCNMRVGVYEGDIMKVKRTLAYVENNRHRVLAPIEVLRNRAA